VKRAPTIGIFGGGQLGRMSILAGRRLGVHFKVFEPKKGSTAAKIADEAVIAGYDDLAAVRTFAKGLDAVTVEFENVPTMVLNAASAFCPVRPNGKVLGIAQNRRVEKTWLKDNGFPCAPFEVIESRDALDAAVGRIGMPAVLKTASFGYDGKGQWKIQSLDDLDEAWDAIGGKQAVLESWVQHHGEVSVIGARRQGGEIALYPLAYNEHRDHILHRTSVPAGVSPTLEAEAVELGRSILEKLECVGLLAIEMFIGKDGHLLVNEIAPRPHNSGHWSIDACITSQFEQHVRAVLDWPLGSTEVLRPAVMINLLGDLWQKGEPDFRGLLSDPSAKLHLYDKGAAAPGRKMGHYTILDADPKAALARAEAHFQRLGQGIAAS
jgi:5-(carboxyamino)imidazole ribonucleotide synthase